MDFPSSVRVRAVTAGLALTIGAGCAPIVTHGPVVEPGWSAGGAASLGVTKTLREPGRTGGLDGLLHSVGDLIVFAGYGSAQAAPDALGVRVGVQLPVFYAVPELAPDAAPMPAALDLYVQLPDGDDGLARGVGVLGGPVYIAPYVQAGSADRGSGWHTTQALALIGGRHVFARPRTLLWMPSLSSTRTDAAGRTYRLDATAGVGLLRYGRSEPLPCPDGKLCIRRSREVTVDRPAWLIQLAFVVEAL